MPLVFILFKFHFRSFNAKFISSNDNQKLEVDNLTFFLTNQSYNRAENRWGEKCVQEWAVKISYYKVENFYKPCYMPI